MKNTIKLLKKSAETLATYDRIKVLDKEGKKSKLNREMFKKKNIYLILKTKK